MLNKAIRPNKTLLSLAMVSKGCESPNAKITYTW